MVVGQATSATIIPSTAAGRRSGSTLIPLQNPKMMAAQDDSMSVILQLGTTNSSGLTAGGGRNVTYRDSRINVESDVPVCVSQQQSPRQHPNSLKTLMPSGLAGGQPGVQPGGLKVIPAHRGAPQMQSMSPAKAPNALPKTANFELHTWKLNVPATPKATPKGRHNSESNKESPVERQVTQVGEDRKSAYNSTIPLMYQYVLQEHNYVAPPPVSPPLSPLLHHQLGTKVNGAPSSGSPSSHGSDHLGTLGKGVGLLTMRPTNHISNSQMNEDAGSDLSSEGGRDAEGEGEETDTALEGEGDEDSITRCICDFEHDDGYMICCDKCSVWQHVDCMGIDRGNIPEEYMCERCQPRWVDKHRARSIQMRKKEEFFSNDTTSDSSSTSTDSEPLTTKKRGPASGGRRKGEPLRKGAAGAGAGMGCGLVPHPLPRQRRESAREPMLTMSGPNRRQQTPRKKSIDNKRQPRRRKSKGTEDEKSPDVWDKSPPLQSLRTWIDHYEEAVTNHYSPELRARIQSIRMNGVYSEVKPPLHLLSTTSGSTKCRVTLLPNGTKILVASCSLTSNQPIIELRGKYMLSSNNKLGSSVPNRGSYMFYHKLPLNGQRDSTEVCVDCRTYGNDARFVRRSCRPNCEIRHCVEKGILHLFLVTLCNIDKNAEITIRHQDGSNVQCGCGSKDCLVPLQSNGRRNGAIDSNEPVRRRRGRRRTVSTTDVHSPTGAGRSPSPLPSPSLVANGASNSPFPTPPTLPALPEHPALPSPVAQTVASDRRTRNSLSPQAHPDEETPKTEPKEEVKEEPEEAKEDEDEEDIKMKEEPEKTKKEEEEGDECPRQPSPPPPPPITRNTMARRCSVANRTPQPEPEPTPAVAASPRRKEREKERDKEPPPVERDHKKKESADKKNKVMTREERKLDAIMKAFERMEKMAEKKREAQTRQARQKSSDKVEETETPSRKENPVERTRRRRRKGRGRLNSSTQAKEPARPQRRTRLLSRTSEPPDEPASSDEEVTSLHLDMSNKTPPQPVDKEQGVPGSGGSSHSSWSQGSTPPTPLSSACLLVAAAVEPLGPGFKFPKTKKGLLSSWFKTPDGASPTTAGTPTLPDMKPLSPDGSNNNTTTPGAGSAGFAKKRWLRQAISEECDSPSRADADAPNYSAPLKKRRMARESMSIDPSDKVLSPKLDDDDTLQEYESDQPTHDEDTMDGVTPGRTGDTETSSHDDASQSAEEAGLNRPKIDDMEAAMEAAMSAIVGHSASEVPQFPSRTAEEEDVVGALVAAAACVPAPVAPTLDRPSEPPATRRKLSISEYRQRNQRASTECCTPLHEANLDDAELLRRGRRRSMSTSSSSSSSLSDEEDRLRSLDTEPIMTKIMALESAAAAATTSILPPLPKDGEQDSLKGTAWNSAPTLVERQRENLTERLRREFGLFVSDDEEQERARRQSLEAAKDGKKKLLLPPPPPPPSVPPPATPPPPPPPPASDVSNIGSSVPVPPLSNFTAPFGTYGASAKSTIVPMPSFSSVRPTSLYPTGKTFYPNYGRP